MCGLFGYQYNTEKTPPLEVRAPVATLLALHTQSRGRHASGYAAFHADDQTTYYDKANETYERSGLIPVTCRETNLIGHCRYATVGAHSKDNAHPFHIGNIVGAHNGGVFNHKELSEKYERTFDVDSMHIIAHLNEDKSFDDFEGYGAVAWFDTRDPGAQYLCRVSVSGELEVEVLPDSQGVIWASTKHILQSAMVCVGWYAKSKAFNMAAHKVYRVFGGAIEETDREIRFRERAVVPYTPSSNAVASVYTTGEGWRHGWGRDADGEWRNMGKSTKSWPETPIETNKTDDIVDPAFDSLFGAATKVAGLTRATIETAMYLMSRRRRRRISNMIPGVRSHYSMCRCNQCGYIFDSVASVATDTK